MNTSTVALAVAFVAANASAADPRTDIALDPVTVSGARVVVDCSHVRLPSHQAVADLIDSNNISLIQSERERALHIAQRACLRGAAFVAFVRDEDSAPPALAQVQP
ncbi:hypothetical protein [Rudaea cellulosilytica]|uniref:hypothetical protein n=1 Tax=Rudaea cellulosilytica TaxID=540746 RepID=UPI00036051AD|nr:hypothetical protein [Rudaea cellulosilytica]